MGSQSYGPPELGADGIVRFESAEHFLRELAENLRKGRLFVRAVQAYRPQEEIRLEIAGPGVDWNVGAAGRVLTARKGYVGLELKNFAAEVAPTLDLLADEVKAKKKKLRRTRPPQLSPVPGESTVVAAAPKAFRAATMADPPAEAERVEPSAAEPMTPSRARRRPRKVSPDDGLDLAEPPPTRQPPPRRSAMPRTRADVPEVYARGDLVDDLSAVEDDTPPGGIDVSDLGGPPPSSESVAATEGLEVPTHSELSAIDPSEIPSEPPAPIEAIDYLTESGLPFPRATAGGVLKTKDPGNLLGLYLSQLRHGHITVLGGPDGAIGDEVTLKIAASHVITLTCRILARVGDWLTLEVEDFFGVEALLRDTAAEWLETLKGIAPNAFAAAVANAAVGPPSSPAVASVAPPPEASVPPPPAPPEDPGPAELPDLEGDVVSFRRRKDLTHELESNLTNGGLFVKSAPLPIREHRTLEIAVGGAKTGVMMEADVVFASDGKVGFSVSAFSEVVDELRAALASGAISNAPSAGGRASQPAQSSISGRLLKPPSMSDLLAWPSKRAKNERDLERTTVLGLLDFLARTGKTCVASLRLKEEKIILYFHEGSVAFVESSSNDEEHRLGRILIHHKKVSEGALRESLDRAKASGRPLGRTLMSMGHLKQNVLSSALREQMRQKVDAAFSWAVGNFEVKPWQEPPLKGDLVLTNGMGFVSRHIRHRFDHVSGDELEDLLAENMSRRVMAVDDSDKLTQGMGLAQKELRFIELMLDGDRTISGAVTGSPLGRLASTRLVALSLALGVAKFTDGTGMRGGRAKPRRPTDARGDALKTALKDHLHLMKSQNHFELIGVHWSASHRTYAGAYEKAKAEFDANKPPLKDAPLEVKTLARDALKLIDEAYAVLASDEQRIRYRKKIFDATEREYSADMLVKQGEVLLLRSDRVGGIEALETAFELNPTPRIKQLLVAAREGRPL